MGSTSGCMIRSKAEIPLIEWSQGSEATLFANFFFKKTLNILIKALKEMYRLQFFRISEQLV